MVCTATVVGRNVVNGEFDNEKKRLCLIGSRISVDIHYAFLSYRQLNGSNNKVAASNMQLAGSDACVEIVLTCLEHKKSVTRTDRDCTWKLFQVILRRW